MIASIIEFLKTIALDKSLRWHLIFILLGFTIWVYIMTISFHWWDIILQPLALLIGWRTAQYGFLGLVPGGGFIVERHVHTIHFWPVLKTWRHRWMFLRENNFSVDFYYEKKEMHKGYPTSVREVTGPAAVTIGIGFNKYLFDLE